MALRGSPELAGFEVEPTFDDVGTEFGEGSPEVLLGGASGQGDQGPMLAAENAFEGMPLLDAAVVRAAGFVQVEKPAPMDWVFGGQGTNADERSPGLVASGGQGFADASDDDCIFPFHPAGWVAANCFDGPETGWAGISQVCLDIPVGQGGIDQHVGDTSHP